ncbi:hypothetical protein BDV97DRAFT_355967 [Delphinella strobiligena]|nr:hypothetical protein BDV97DRAFT_355967 [Delphinella strobiligena]
MPGLPSVTVPQTAQFGAQQHMPVPGGGPVRQPTPANANPGLPDPPLNIVQPGQAVAQLPGAQLPGEQEVRELVRQFNQERENPPGDVLAQWQPLLAQFWLLFRVMLFAYFFFPTHQGWYRPLAMAFVCLAFWLLNGDGPGRGVRDAVRSWWEGVAGIPARPEAPQPGAQAAPPVIQPVQHQPEPELHWLRQTFRPIERALALFVASFWPGIGERTVAARRAEEERQRREEQERITAANEEAARRELAENETLNASAPPETENNNDTSSMLAEAGSTAGEQEAASTTTRATATGAQVDGAELLRERKTLPRAATVEEEKDDDDATATQAASSNS